MDVEAFVDDRRLTAPHVLQARGEEQHFEVAGDQDIRDASRLHASPQDGRCSRDGKHALSEPRIEGLPQFVVVLDNDVRSGTGGTAEPSQTHCGSSILQHSHAPLDGRIPSAAGKVKNIKQACLPCLVRSLEPRFSL